MAIVDSQNLRRLVALPDEPVMLLLNQWMPSEEHDEVLVVGEAFKKT